ncbi:glutamate 5-kinase [Desulfuribacillus alkaliarsenatis]|uniref:Glutamate 5-kinase n=1 Tax=Desulfuribacillus alkaliarsenatis TaxID=766136 RepID=A0A1E5FYR6_9FIRM|nr:glutamate 5-kinase [Desulfuribacillus alkaliarsenatis]OEF95641.1 glutamate 5-kinase [Desulfuribacillus alkaliarsenatis]
MKNRVVVKVGSSSITIDGTINHEQLEKLTTQIAYLTRKGFEVVLVSSGAVAAGLGRLHWERETLTLPQKQAAAAVGQGLLMHRYEQLFQCEGLHVAQILLTSEDVSDRKRYINAKNTFQTLLQNGIIPIVNENDTVAVDEIKFGDNDRLAALVTAVVEADALLLLTDIDGLYTDNPKENPDAKKIDIIEAIDESVQKMAKGAGSKAGTGGMATKIEAARIATLSGATVTIANGSLPWVLKRLFIEKELIGTKFLPAKETMKHKKQWLAFASKAQGKIYIDSGATQAIHQNNKSLLLAGLRNISGDFCAGSVIEICTEEGLVIGKGISGLSSGELRMLLKEETLPKGVIVVHKNDLFIV